MDFKTIIKKTKIYNWLKNKGLLSKESRRYLFINFIFQRILRLNKECTWSVNFTSTIIEAKKIKIGKDVWKSFMLSGNCYIQASNGLEIGEGTIFAPGVKIISANHDPTNIKKHIKTNPIKIGRNCWIGANAVILPGVVLGDNTIVGAGSVVTQSFSTGNQVLVGNPAHILRTL